MPSLAETLRERGRILTETYHALTDEISNTGGIPDEAQETRLRDLEAEINGLNPRLSQAVSLENSVNASIALMARSHSVPPVPDNRQPETMYRDAGEYLAEYCRAMANDAQARTRLTAYLERAAANQTTVDNPGVVPDPIVGGVLSWIDTMRPIVQTLGIRTLPAYPTFYRPSISQHTQVGVQTAEKTEISSRKMTISRLTVTAKTYGGYVDLSLQNNEFSNPAIMQILVQDLAGQYALATEADAAATLASLTQTQEVVGTPGPQTYATAIYAAAGKVYAATGRLPDVVFASVDSWGKLGALFPSTNPQNAYADGFNAGTFGGAVVGLRLVIAPQLPANTIIVGTTAAMEVYEQRVGTLQALEVSLLGMQVGYAGFFADVVVIPNGFCKVVDLVAPPGTTTTATTTASK